MPDTTISGVPLRLRVALARANRFSLAAAAALVLVTGGWCAARYAAWTLEQRARQLEIEVARTLPADALGAPAAAWSPVPEPDNLRAFYALLAPRQRAGREVALLFGLARKHGLSLRQGEYATVYDREAHLYSYQIRLPVRGGYDKIWAFVLDALRAMPFAALDDLSFRREAIGDATVEAKMRLTLYLADDLGDGL
jgi:hypothetical protein